MSDTLQVMQQALSVQQVDILPIAALLQRLLAVQECMGKAMQKDVHYGIIPGTQKPTLLQPGAQMLCTLFRLAPEYSTEYREQGGGHTEVIAKCRMTCNGVFVGEGYGSCSTMESKYRFTSLSEKAILEDTALPTSYWNLKKKDPDAAQKVLETMAQGRGGEGVIYTPVKDDKGIWRVGYRKHSEEKAEHPNPTDHRNTILKMAIKRALIAATLGATGASDMFTQDMEDLQANESALKPNAAQNPVDGNDTKPAPEKQPDARKVDTRPKQEPINRATTKEKALSTVIPWEGWKRRCLGEASEAERKTLTKWAAENGKEPFAEMITIAFAPAEKKEDTQAEPLQASDAMPIEGSSDIPSQRVQTIILIQEQIESQGITVDEFIEKAVAKRAWPEGIDRKLSALPDQWLSDLLGQIPLYVTSWGMNNTARRQPRKL